MLKILVPALAGTLFSVFAPALAGDKINYVACKADNEDTVSVFGIDDSAQKICDRSVDATWFSPSTFEPAKIIWNDGLSTKAIYRTGDKRYEHDFLLLVHTGHCEKFKEPAASQTCKSP
jgi:hypothetical protein